MATAMEKTPTTTLATDAPPKSPETAEVVLGEFLTLDDLERVEPAAPETVEAGAAPAAPVTPVPVAAAPPEVPPAAPAAAVPPLAEPPKGDVKGALREERGKRKQANARAEFWQRTALDIKASRDRASEALRLRGVVAPRVDEAQIREIVEEAKRADDLGVPVNRILRLMNQHYESFEAKLEQAFRQREVDRAERAFRRAHPDYADALSRAGIYEAIAVDPTTGTWRDPKVGRAVFVDGEDNPAEAAYFLAKGMLGEPIDEEETPPAPPAAPHPVESAHVGNGQPAASTPTPVSSSTATPPPTPTTVVEAVREGARQVIERVNDNANRVRGVRVLREAGTPNRVQLDENFHGFLSSLMEQNPDKFLAFMTKNPDIDRWFMAYEHTAA